MKGPYEIRATPVTQLPHRWHIGTTFTIAGYRGKDETKISAWMPQKTIETWGFEWHDWRQEVDSGAARLLARLALSYIVDCIRRDKELDEEIPIRLSTYGDEKPEFKKECFFQELGDSGLFCKVRTEDDPHRGETTDLLCAGCQMPDRMLKCRELMHPMTQWSPGKTKAGIRETVEVKCNAENDPGKGADCTPGVRECWVVDVEGSK